MECLDALLMPYHIPDNSLHLEVIQLKFTTTPSVLMCYSVVIGVILTRILIQQKRLTTLHVSCDCFVPALQRVLTKLNGVVFANIQDLQLSNKTSSYKTIIISSFPRLKKLSLEISTNVDFSKLDFIRKKEVVAYPTLESLQLKGFEMQGRGL